MTSSVSDAGTTPPRPVPHAVVGDLMRPAATTVEPAAHLAGAAYLMKHSGDSALVITTDDARRRPVAIITDTDISHAVADGRNLEETRISDLAAEPITVGPQTAADEAARTMLLHRIHHLPVVDGDRLIGIVDMADLCRVLVADAVGPVR